MAAVPRDGGGDGAALRGMALPPLDSARFGSARVGTPSRYVRPRDKVIVKAELPGVKKEDIDISIAGGVLTIKGEREVEEEVKDEDYYCCERFRGTFYRAIQLPTDVETEKIEANYADGILEITLPKVPEVKPKKIEVKVK